MFQKKPQNVSPVIGCMSLNQPHDSVAASYLYTGNGRLSKKHHSQKKIQKKILLLHNNVRT